MSALAGFWDSGKGRWYSSPREKVLHLLNFYMAKPLKQIWLFTFTHLAESEAFSAGRASPPVPDNVSDVALCLAKSPMKAEVDSTPLEKKLSPRKDTAVFFCEKSEMPESQQFAPL